jgi:hypothetical protein
VQPYRPGRGFLHAEMKARLGIGTARASSPIETPAESASRTR